MKKILPLFILFILAAAGIVTAQTDANFMAGEQAFNAGNYIGAVDNYSKYIGTFQNGIPAYVTKLHSYDTATAYEKNTLFAGFVVHHDWAIACYKRGLANVKNRKTSEAERDFDMAIQIDSKFPDPYFEKGLLMKDENKDAACKYINKALMMGDTSKLAKQIYISNFCSMTGIDYAVKGKTEISTRQYAEALKNFDIALSYCYDSASYYAYKGIAYEELGKPDSALAEYAFAIHIDSNSYLGYYRRALAYEKAQKYDSAFKDLTRVLVLNPKFAEGYIHHASDCENLNMSDAALYDYQQILRLKPNEGVAWYKIGLNRKENGLEACSYFEKAVELGYEDAQSYADDCKKEEARKALK